MVNNKRRPHSFRYQRNRTYKRILDLCLSLVIFLGMFPLSVLILPLLLCLQGRPLLHRSYRCISADREIMICKIRSMAEDAESGKFQLAKRYMEEGYLNIPPESEVFTVTGKILERLQIVEIPQVINVILGQMSLVGNRPLPKANIELLKRKPCWEERFDCPAGLTGVSQIVGKHSLRADERLRLERMYARVFKEGHILLCDLNVLFRTMLLIVSGKRFSFERAERLLKKCGGSLD